MTSFISLIHGGELGSYNLFENGSDYPWRITQTLINVILRKGRYLRVYTAGTSKGGTCAIYYGLLFRVNEVFSGACQYNLGTYLWREEFRKIFYGMMGKGTGKNEVAVLNQIIKQKIKECKGNDTIIHVFYSKKELTYERQIVDLLHDLDTYGIPHLKIESDFEKHEDVASPFVQYVFNYLGERLQ